MAVVRQALEGLRPDQIKRKGPRTLRFQLSTYHHKTGHDRLPNTFLCFGEENYTFSR